MNVSLSKRGGLYLGGYEGREKGRGKKSGSDGQGKGKSISLPDGQLVGGGVNSLESFLDATPAKSRCFR
jgi:hypothetical protein